MRERLEPLLEQARELLERAARAIERGSQRLAAETRRAWSDFRRRRAERRERSRASAAAGGRRTTRRDRERDAVGDSFATVVAERDDDIASITGRIDTAADANVVLLVPKAARGMRDAALWPHIAAHARRRGIALAVVSARRDVRGHAAANGLVTARSLSALQRHGYRIRIGDRELRVPPVPWRELTTVVVLGGAVFAVITGACYAIPTAEIVIVPQSSEFTTSLRVRLSPLADETDIGAGVLPARNLRVITTATLAVQTSGEAEVPDEPATVTLEFTNEGEEEIEVPDGTRVLDDSGTAFRTDENVVVPPAGSAEVTATAVEPGPGGNVEAETLTAVEGVADAISVTNPAAASGGTTTTGPGVGEGDLERVREIANDALETIGSRALEREVEDGRVFPQTQNIAILSETPLANIGDPADYLLVEYEVVATALALTGEDLAAYAPELVRSRLSQGMALLPGTASASANSPAQLDGGNVTLTVEARGQVAPLFDAEAAGNAVSGERPATASQRLIAMLDLIEPPRITIEPEIVPWQWLPRRADRIAFVFAAAGTLEEEDTDDGEADATGTPGLTPTGTVTATPTPETGVSRTPSGARR